MSSIDIETLTFKNFDGTVYQNEMELKTEAIELSAKKARVDKMEDGSYHPSDLMAHKLREHLERENRKSLTFLYAEDEKLEMLFKHYMVIQSYQHAFEELIKRAE